ncbi:MAG: hypothetical protein M3451_07700 [Chloroflexota bacterium]|nr:hypothetical protein [Chloroflexota bacterium]
MRRPVLALTALVACVAALTTALTVIATDNLFGLDDDALRAPQGTFIPDEDLASLPVFTTEDQELVKEVALADPRVQAILEGHAYQVAQVGMWTGERLSLIGGIVDIAFEGPSTVTGEWYTWSTPNCETNPDEDPIIVPFRATYSDVTSIHVLVNLQTGVVDNITPFSHDEYHLIGEEEFTGEHQEIKLCGID